MTPTVGRIVHYHAPCGDPHGAELAVVPAIVCAVESDMELTLYVLDKVKGARFVAGAKEVGEVAQSGRWQWVPNAQAREEFLAKNADPKAKPGKDYAQPKDASKTDAPVSA